MAEIAEKKFYVLRAISGKENKVKEQLEGDMKNTDLGLYLYSVIIPTEKVVSQRNGKKIVKERPYLPGYIVIEATLVGDVAHRLRNTQNVIGFLGSKSGTPEPLKKSEVDRLLGRADDINQSEAQYDVEFFVGEVVKVSDGAFNGCDAIVEEVYPSKHKLKVSVKMFGRKMPVELGYSQVVKE